jgi:hypothetical protein
VYQADAIVFSLRVYIAVDWEGGSLVAAWLGLDTHDGSVFLFLFLFLFSITNVLLWPEIK